SRQNYSGSRQEAPSWSDGYQFFQGDAVNIQWVGELAKKFSNHVADNKLSSSQLRAFYNEFIRIRDITADATEKNILIRLLEAKISYRHTARKSDMPVAMVEFISNLVNQIGDDPVKFKQACYIMEAVVCFFPKK
ncbi:MAG: type III-A CRISPR-associated protein Csm2, partial [Candidatus Cloacimonetes bacterium]|nr:type III-A CRISPR-associated protein Csm2 [Candidatus Cloacimonadota bacterium]